MVVVCVWLFFFQAEDGIRDLVRSRGLGDVYKRQQQAATISSGKENLASRSTTLPIAAAAKLVQIINLSLIHI